MSLLTAKSASIRSRSRYPLFKVTALFALAESSLFATSLGVGASNQSRLSSSTFGITNRSSPSHSIRNTSTRLSSNTATITEQNQEYNASMSAKTPASKLVALRARMKELSLDCYIIPTDDPHLSGKSTPLRT